MHTEAVQTRVFNMAPVTEDTQLHNSINLVTGVLQEGTGGKKRKREGEKNKIKRDITCKSGEMNRQEK